MKGKIKFPSSFPSNAKSLVKHLLVQDLSKRYGNLKAGVNDIKNHRFFKELDWSALVKYKLKAPFVPNVSGKGDCDNFACEEEDEDDRDVPSNYEDIRNIFNCSDIKYKKILSIMKIYKMTKTTLKLNELHFNKKKIINYNINYLNIYF